MFSSSLLPQTAPPGGDRPSPVRCCYFVFFSNPDRSTCQYQLASNLFLLLRHKSQPNNLRVSWNPRHSRAWTDRECYQRSDDSWLLSSPSHNPIKFSGIHISDEATGTKSTSEKFLFASGWSFPDFGAPVTLIFCSSPFVFCIFHLPPSDVASSQSSTHHASLIP